MIITGKMIKLQIANKTLKMRRNPMTMRQLVCVVIVMAIAGIAIAQTIIIEPSDDMYSDPEHPGAHPSDELWVANYDPTGNYQRIMMKFDLDEYLGQEIDSAILNINRFFGCPSGEPTNTDFYDITATWDESSWLENTHISHSTTVWANYVFSSNGWHRIDITPLVQEWLNCTIPNYGFVIEARPGNKFSKFYSKEAASSVRPYLELFATTGIEEETNIPENFLIQIYPNPFNSSCRISTPEDATIEIYDLRGNVLATQNRSQEISNFTSEKSRRRKTTEWLWKPDESLPSGVYLIRATKENKTITRHAILMK